MTGLGFLLPEVLPGLLVAPLVALLGILRDRARTQHLFHAVGPRSAALTGARKRRWVCHALLGTGLCCAVLALAQPTWGEDEYPVATKGADILVCLDVSRSMLARDLSPDRLGRAHAELRALAGHAGGSRMGLVAFAGTAHLVVPLTRDLPTFAEIAERTDSLAAQRGGSDLGAALDAAFRALPGGTEAAQVVLLLTDGEDHQDRGLRAARVFRAQDIPVHCVGLGSVRGSKIPIPAVTGETFLRDGSGVEVISAMNPVSLQRLAAATGGTFVDAASTEDALVRLYDSHILPAERTARATAGARPSPNRFQWPLAAGLLLWILALARFSRSHPTRR